jgi:hypothetical protein
MTTQAIQVQAFQEATANLGRLQGRFVAKSTPFFAIIGIVMMFLAALVGAQYFTTTSKVMDREGMLIFAIIFGVLGALPVRSWLMRRGKVIEVYEQGLARIQGKQVKVTRWDDIDAVWQRITRHYHSGMYTGTTYVYTIQARNGERFNVSQIYKDIEALGQIIQSEVTARQLPPIVRAYQSGQTVNFGKLSLNTQGLIFKDKQLAWNQIQDLKIDRGYISVKQEGGRWFNWAQVTADSVPNLFVFLALIDNIVGIRTGK